MMQPIKDRWKDITKNVQNEKKYSKEINLTTTTQGIILTNMIFSVMVLFSYPMIRSSIFGKTMVFKNAVRYELLIQDLQSGQMPSSQTINLIENYIMDNIMLLSFIMIGFIIIIALLALLTPYRRQSQSGIVRKFNTVKIEWKFLVIPILLLIIVMMGLSFHFSGSAQATGVYTPHLLIGRLIVDINHWYFIIGMLLVTPLAVYEYLMITNIKGMTALGFKKGVVDNSLLLTFLRQAGRRVHHEAMPKIKRFLTIDIQNFYIKKLLILFGLSLLALIFIVFVMGNYVLHTFNPMDSLFAIYIAGVFMIGAFFIVIYEFLQKIEYLTIETQKMAEGLSVGKLKEELGAMSRMSHNLNNIAEGFQKAVQKELNSQKTKNELITNVSHDLKTPLTSVINYADLLRDGTLEENTKKEYIDIIYKKSKRLQTLIEDLFEMTKASSGTIYLNIEVIDIIALFHQAFGEMKEKFNKANLQAIIDLPEEKVYCKLDGQKTHRILENLFSNIAKYTLPGTRIYLEGKVVKEECIFTFKNISAYEMNFSAEDVAERFFRGDPARSTEGSGLGLAIAQNLTQLQGGRMEIAVDGDLFKAQVVFKIEK